MKSCTIASETPPTLRFKSFILPTGSGIGSAKMASQTAAYDPETVATLTAVLDQAFLALPPNQRLQERKTVLASKILSAASTGERDPVRLKAAALAMGASGAQ